VRARENESGMNDKKEETETVKKKKNGEWKRTEKNQYKYFTIFMLIPHFLDVKEINKSYSRPKYLRVSNVLSCS